jgi:hypothetical protein
MLQFIPQHDSLVLLQGKPVHGLLTDRRIILRESSGSCGFPLDLCCVCFKVRMLPLQSST